MKYKVTELADEHPGYPAPIGAFTTSNDELGQIITNALEARGYTVTKEETSEK